ncbi:TRAP transporter small permease [Halalkalibacter krulwichiae]|uniref:2,3-diketo-L-gulonate TRAP transporter small permease protein YiaM n=1 Tax=Halalkalibacter krulwichiae TaxID=199441 RepID=A0A1X9MHY0_9BACI|nr:TRAP transporter small permease [Halalkalibacter krulwichiae]ARK31211.1 2,3-diketo-L-gulonate TRAP transporter small permease protein YiaM [Halalkalibacter krulwichiae]
MKTFKWLEKHFEEIFLVIFTVIMVTAIFVQVVMRYVLGSSLAWSEELARYCFIWLVYLGISYGVKKQRHIKVDIILLFLKDRWKIVVNILANVIFLSFAIFVVVYGYDIAKTVLTYGQKSPALQIPMGLVYLATPVGMGVTALRLIQQIVRQVRTLINNEEFDVKTEQEMILENSQLANDKEKKE